MTTLSERAVAIHSSIVDAGRQQVSVKFSQQLTVVAARSDEAISQLHFAAEMEAAIREAHIPVQSLDKKVPELAKSARRSLKSTATRLEGPDLDEAAAIQLLNGAAFQEALKTAENVVARLANRLTQALESDRSTWIPATLDDPVPDVPGRSLIVGNLGRRQEKLLRGLAVAPEDFTAEGVERLLARRADMLESAAYWEEEYPRLLAALGNELPEVQAFLRAAATPEGAPLSLLTPEVRSRLEEDDLLADFRITKA